MAAVDTFEKVKAAARKKRARTNGQTMIDRKRREVVALGGPAEFIKLCDVGELDHVCGEVLRSAFAECREGSSSEFPASIQRLLIEPLERYSATLNDPVARPPGVGASRRMEEEPTLHLLLTACQVRDAIRLGPWAPDDEDHAVQSLSATWLRWIAFAASEMLQRFPELLAQKEVSRDLGRLGGQAPKDGDRRSNDRAPAILAKRQKLLAGGTAPRSVASIIARELKISARWVRAVIKCADSSEAMGGGGSTPSRKAEVQASL